MEMKDLRREAAANILALHNQKPARTDCSLDILSQFLRRSLRTLRRWEAAPDRLTEFAYQYLAGHLFGWESVRWNLRRRELELWHSGSSLTTVHRNHIISLPEFLRFWQRHQEQAPPENQPEPLQLPLIITLPPGSGLMAGQMNTLKNLPTAANSDPDARPIIL